MTGASDAKRSNDAILRLVANAIRITRAAAEDINDQGYALEAIRWFQEQLERELVGNRVEYDMAAFNREATAK